MDILHKKIRSLTLKQIAYAVATADAGNVSLAARRLNVSQPALSAAIQSLEALFGHRIFIRNPGQGVAPTSFGQTVLVEARALLAHVETFSSLGDPSALPRGQVVLGCARVLAPEVLPGLLRHLADQLPSVAIRFVEVDLDEAPTLLRQDNADMTISPDVGFDEDMDTRALYTATARLLCAVDHPLASRSAVALRELAGESWILLDQEPSTRHLVGLLKGLGMEPRVAARVTDPSLHRAMIAQDHGVGLSHAAPVLDAGALARVPITDPSLSDDVLLARCVQPRYHPAVAAVHAAIVDWFRSDIREFIAARA